MIFGDVRDLRQLDSLGERSRARIQKHEDQPVVGQPFTIENMLDMLEAALACAPSKSTLAQCPM
jgi:hypothetical protein